MENQQVSGLEGCDLMIPALDRGGCFFLCVCVCVLITWFP